MKRNRLNRPERDNFSREKYTVEEKEIYDEQIFNIIEEIEDIIDEYEGKTGIEQALASRPVR